MKVFKIFLMVAIDSILNCVENIWQFMGIMSIVCAVFGLIFAICGYVKIAIFLFILSLCLYFIGMIMDLCIVDWWEEAKRKAKEIAKNENKN